MAEVRKPGRSVRELMASWPWRPIRHCPGRFVLAGGPRRLTVEELAGEGVGVLRITVLGLRDGVAVAFLEGGGLIAYERADGTVVHTLNTAEGMARKLDALGIALRPPEGQPAEREIGPAGIGGINPAGRGRV
ncbi:MAG: hypothetical protein WBS54_02200 [Acidobacteriota bacterium]